MAEPAPTLEAAQVDFLYWHAVSKMRMADFEGAGILFQLLYAANPGRTDVALGRLYCLLRKADYDSAAGLMTALRRRPLPTDEMALLGRLQRRCEFERARCANRQRLAHRGASMAAEPVAMPHTLGDDDMARRSAERR